MEFSHRLEIAFLIAWSFVAVAAAAQPDLTQATKAPTGGTDMENFNPSLQWTASCQEWFFDVGRGSLKAEVEAKNVGELQTPPRQVRLVILETQWTETIDIPALNPGETFEWGMQNNPDGCVDCTYEATLLGSNQPVQKFICGPWNPACGLLGVEPLPLVLLAYRRRRAGSAERARVAASADR